MQEGLLRQARECRFFRGALLEFATELPSNDDALDRLIAEAVATRENESFVTILFAALGRGRRVDARHLEEGASLFKSSAQLAGAAMHLSGDVSKGLIAAVERNTLDHARNVTALLLAAVWCREKGDTRFPPELIVQARLMARRHPRHRRRNHRSMHPY